MTQLTMRHICRSALASAFLIGHSVLSDARAGRVARAVIFDYYFTLAEPSGADVVGIARSLGCTASADEVEAARRAF